MLLMDIKPRMVIGQLFIKDGPTVTTRLGVTTPNTDGKALAESRTSESNSVTPALVRPCMTRKMLSINRTISQLMLRAKALRPLRSPRIISPLRLAR
jgi:hypothetical protein